MVLRARWILVVLGDPDEEAVPGEDRGAGGREDLLLPGPETLILARPEDGVDDVDGEDSNELDIEEWGLGVCPPVGLLMGDFVGVETSSARAPSFAVGVEANIEALPPIESDFFAAEAELEVALSSAT